MSGKPAGATDLSLSMLNQMCFHFNHKSSGILSAHCNWEMIGSKLVYCFLKVTFKIDSLLLKHESLQVKNSASYLLPALLSHSSPCPDHTFPLLLSWFGFTVACLLLLLYINIFSINTFSAFLYYYFWRFLSLYIYSTSLLPCPFLSPT